MAKAQSVSALSSDDLEDDGIVYTNEDGAVDNDVDDCGGDGIDEDSNEVGDGCTTSNVDMIMRLLC